MRKARQAGGNRRTVPFAPDGPSGAKVARLPSNARYLFERYQAQHAGAVAIGQLQTNLGCGWGNEQGLRGCRCANSEVKRTGRASVRVGEVNAATARKTAGRRSSTSTDKAVKVTPTQFACVGQRVQKVPAQID